MEMNKADFRWRAAMVFFVAALCALVAMALPARGQLGERFRERWRERIGDRQAVNGSGNPENFIEVGERQRTYIVHLPAGYDGKAALPLVVVFHGGGGNAANAARMSGMSAKADKEKFIAVYPNGTGPWPDRFLTWNTWSCCGSVLDNNVDDVEFVRALIGKLEREYLVDPKRIYATGLSNGGMMTYRAGCELSDLFAAIAPVAGALDTTGCRPAFSVSVIIFHGTADKHILYEGGEPVKAFDRNHHRVDKPVSYAVNFWVQRDGCSKSLSTRNKVTLLAMFMPAARMEPMSNSISSKAAVIPGREASAESASEM
jgi:polyhydroxybutyrate depolymerase